MSHLTIEEDVVSYIQQLNHDDIQKLLIFFRLSIGNMANLIAYCKKCNITTQDLTLARNDQKVVSYINDHIFKITSPPSSNPTDVQDIKVFYKAFFKGFDTPQYLPQDASHFGFIQARSFYLNNYLINPIRFEDSIEKSLISYDLRMYLTEFRLADIRRINQNKINIHYKVTICNNVPFTFIHDESYFNELHIFSEWPNIQIANQKKSNQLFASG